MKVTFTHNGVQYKDYEFLTPNIDYLSKGQYTYVLGAPEHNTLHNRDNLSSTLQNIHPNKGSSLYIAQPCPLCNADIRKNYTIKRSPDSADYCVISPIEKDYCRLCVYASAIVPKYRQIMVFLSKHYAITHSISSHVHTCMPSIDDRDVIYISEIFYLYEEVLSDFHIDFVNDRITKPVVYYNNLDMDTGNKVDLDLLYLVYKTGGASGSKDDFEKMVLQLESLNQHNWRDYPGTMCLLFKVLLRGQRTYYNWAWGPSKLPKAVKQFAYRNVPDVSFDNLSHDDFDMSRRFLSLLLGINGTMYATLDSTEKKIKTLDLTPDIIDTFFNVAVRIAPKTTNN